MPFTFSHPAIILPLISLRKRWVSTTGLVVGSLTPDFEYFLRMTVVGEIGHTIAGIFLFDLPVGIIVAFVFHNVVRNSLFANLPAPLASRFAPFTTFHWNRHFRNAWVVVILSIITGAASHIFWDAFTHRDAFFVKLIPALSVTVNLFDFPIEMFRLLQHLSTLVGAIVIVYAISRLPKNEQVPRRINTRYWMMVMIIAMITIAIKAATGIKYYSVANFVVIMISAGMVGLTLAPLGGRRKRKESSA